MAGEIKEGTEITEASKHQVFRGDYVNQAYMVKLMQKKHYWESHRKGDRMVSVVTTMKHGGGVMVWLCFADDTVANLLRIQDKHSAAKTHPIWLVLIFRQKKHNTP